jgi:hypothetical protein
MLSVLIKSRPVWQMMHFLDTRFVRNDPTGNVKPYKEKSVEKIYGAVATIMALDRAIRCGICCDDFVYNN